MRAATETTDPAAPSEPNPDAETDPERVDMVAGIANPTLREHLRLLRRLLHRRPIAELDTLADRARRRRPRPMGVR